MAEWKVLRKGRINKVLRPLHLLHHCCALLPHMPLFEGMERSDGMMKAAAATAPQKYCIDFCS